MVPEELGQLWAEYYPKRQTDPDALQICVSVSTIVKEKALRASLEQILNVAGIPIDQYDQFELESIAK